ncbi:hypothetical protein L6452_37796 [Arctium lappa]|uniref:Uncharacterized protein n=1 Tax=Arctium lappa TaxID=4217 RepID=A0ACB8Y3Z2_ARCLA|nr:hypothetical protein L6452_37796 [Arctium lappa]
MVILQRSRLPQQKVNSHVQEGLKNDCFEENFHYNDDVGGGVGGYGGKFPRSGGRTHNTGKAIRGDKDEGCGLGVDVGLEDNKKEDRANGPAKLSMANQFKGWIQSEENQTIRSTSNCEAHGDASPRHNVDIM